MDAAEELRQRPVQFLKTRLGCSVTGNHHYIQSSGIDPASRFAQPAADPVAYDGAAEPRIDRKPEASGRVIATLARPQRQYSARDPHTFAKDGVEVGSALKSLVAAHGSAFRPDWRPQVKPFGALSGGLRRPSDVCDRASAGA